MLERQNIEIPFAAGLDTKTDPKLVGAGSLLRLENGIFTKGGTIAKRNGYSALGRGLVGSASSISSGLALATFNDELLLFDQAAKLYSYSKGNDAWISKGAAVPLLVDVAPIVRNTYAQSAPDAATFNGVTIYVWKDGRNGIRCSVIDELTGNPLQVDVSLSSSANALMPRVAVVGSKFLIAYVDGTNLRTRTIDPANPLTITAELTPITDVAAANQVLDLVATPAGDAGVFAYTANATNVKIGYLTSTGTLGIPSPVSVAEAGTGGIAIAIDSATSQLYVAYANGTQGLRCVAYNTDLSVKVAATTIDASTSVVNVTGIFTTATQITWFYEVTAAATYNHLLKSNTFTTAGAAGSAATLKRSVGLASKAFSHSTGFYFVAVQDSTLQATYFLLKSDGTIAGRFLQLNASGLTAKSVPTILRKSADVWLFPALNKTRFLSQGNAVFTLVGLSKATLTFNSILQYVNGQLGQSLLVAGGVPTVFDGQSLVEAGFHVYPENGSVVMTGSGGSLSAGAYQWVVVYEWIDNKGQIHRSAPSPAISATAVLNDKATLTIPTLRLTSRTGSRTDVMIAVYRTQVNGTIFYKVSSNTAPTYNDPTVDTISFLDGTADTSISSNEPLYTTGGAVANNAPPPSPILTVTKNRVWLLDLDKKTLWFSKVLTPGRAIEFSEQLTITVDPAGGDVAAIQSMDEKVVVFKRDRIFVITGDGPDDTGANGSFSSAQLVTTDVGCTQPLSIAPTPAGLLFKSDKGIYLLGRNLEVDYLGAPVEDFNTLTIASGDLVEGSNQVRFVVSSGSSPVFHYYFGQWSVFTNHAGVDAIIWGGSYVYLRADGTVYVEAPSVYQDAGVDIHLLLETAWLKVAGIQGFQRVQRAAFLGDFKSAHILNVKVSYDYQPFAIEEHNFDPSTALYSGTWGSDATWGASGTKWGGGADLVYQVRFMPKQQKCEAIKFLLQDLGSNPGQGFTISNLTLSVGVKPGIARLPAGKTV